MEIESLVKMILVSNVIFPATVTALFAASLAAGLQSGLTKQWCLVGAVTGVYLSLSRFYIYDYQAITLQLFGRMIMTSGLAAAVILFVISIVEVSTHWALARGQIEQHWCHLVRGGKIALVIFVCGISLEYIGAVLELL